MIYHKTKQGQDAFQRRAAELTSKLRAIWLLFDGVRTDSEVLQSTAGLGISQVDIEHLLALGFIEPSAELAFGDAAPPTAQQANPVDKPKSEVDAQQRYIEASHLATALTAKLGLRGFRLNLAVESANNLQDLRALLPRIQEAVGHEAARPLDRLLRSS